MSDQEKAVATPADEPAANASDMSADLAELKSEALNERADESASVRGVARDALVNLGMEAQRGPSPWTTGVGTVQGDHVTTKVVYVNQEPDGDHRPPILRLSPEQLDEVREAYVEHDGYGKLSTILGEERRVLLLRVRSGQGGGTAGARLLVDAGARKLFELAPDVDLRKLSMQPIEKGSGYLVRAKANAVAQLTAFDLLGLEKAMTEHRSWSVVTVDPAVHLADDVLWRYAASLGRPPDAVTIVSTHLRYRLGPERSATADSLLEDAQVQAMVQAWLVGDNLAERAARLARMLHEATRDPDFSLDSLHKRLELLPSDTFDTWFDGADDVSTRCLVISLAVLHGFPYETVSDAARSLERRLVPEDPDTPTEPTKSPFGTRRSQRLESALARLIRTTEPARYGDVPIDIVRFFDPSWPQRILERVWREYDDARPALMAWLAELIRHPSQYVRVFAAASAGYLSLLSFPYMRAVLLEQWADSDDYFDREAAAVAIAVPARDPTHAFAARRVLRDWQRESASHTRRYTAARAYGGRVGQLDPVLAMRALVNLAAVADRRTRHAIRDSVADLVTEGDDASVDTVLDGLRQWMDWDEQKAASGAQRTQRTRAENLDRARSVRFSAYFAFLGLCYNIRLRYDADTTAVAWPGVLWVSDTSDERRSVIADLWHSALNSAMSSGATRDVLDKWARDLNRDPRGCAALGRLLVDCARHGERTLRIIQRQVQLWAAPGGAAAATAAAVTAAFHEAGLS